MTARFGGPRSIRFLLMDYYAMVPGGGADIRLLCGRALVVRNSALPFLVLWQFRFPDAPLAVYDTLTLLWECSVIRDCVHI